MDVLLKLDFVDLSFIIDTYNCAAPLCLRSIKGKLYNLFKLIYYDTKKN